MESPQDSIHNGSEIEPEISHSEESPEKADNSTSNTEGKPLRRWAIFNPPRSFKPARKGFLFQMEFMLGAAILLATLFTAWTPGRTNSLFPIPTKQGIQQALQPTPTFLPGQPTPTLPNPRLIGIVAGHYKNDAGAVCSDGLTEVEINLNIATIVQKILVDQGYQVELLQEFDKRLTGYQAAALVSIHNDSCDFVNNEATGFKVAQAFATRHPDRAARLTSCLRARYGEITGLPLHSTSVTQDMTGYHAFGEISEVTPAAIIETGFLNLDRTILTQEPDKVAKGVAAGILCYLRNESMSSQSSSTPNPTTTSSQP